MTINLHISNRNKKIIIKNNLNKIKNHLWNTYNKVITIIFKIKIKKY
jgi:hypothetical protein